MKTESQVIVDSRACTILYNFIKSNELKGTWLVPANICHFVPATLIKANQKVDLIDINPTHLCIDTHKVMTLLKQKPQKYAGIIFVETFGVNNYAKTFFEDIKKVNNDIKIIYDKCLSKPIIEIEYSPVVDMFLYSTGYSKYIDISYGGFAYLPNYYHYENCITDYSESDEEEFNLYFKEQIELEQYVKSNIIYKGWLIPSNNKINKNDYFKELNSQLEIVDAHKKSINEIYSRIIPSEIQLTSNYHNWRFNIVVDNKKEILDLLFANDLFASGHYYPLNKLWKTSNNCLETTLLHNHVINLFNDFRYDTEKAKKTAHLIASVYQ